MKTRRAETIEACADAADTSGMAIIAHMPRMIEFYKKRTNEQLRAARTADDALAVADARAKLELVKWAESWMRGPVDTWPHREAERDRTHAYNMNAHLAMIGYSIRYLVQAYADHPQFRPEWRPSPD